MNGKNTTPRPPDGEDNGVMKNNGDSKIKAAASESRTQQDEPDAGIAQDASQKIQQAPLAQVNEELQQLQRAHNQLILQMLQNQQAQHNRDQRARQGLPAQNELPARVIDYSPLNHYLQQGSHILARTNELLQLLMEPQAQNDMNQADGEDLREKEVEKPQTAAELQKAQCARIHQMIQKQQAEHLKNHHAQQDQQAQNEPTIESTFLSDLIKADESILQRLYNPNGNNMNPIPLSLNILNLRAPQVQNTQIAAISQDDEERQRQLLKKIPAHVDGKTSLYQVYTAGDSQGHHSSRPTPKRAREADESEGRSCFANRRLKNNFHIIMSPHFLRCSSHLSLPC
ncbi:hypothetical protein L5515_017159 [Caenorhabditis briggsae]|uniref:Uncharacterized protein n=1 Tax=Caenorhabditis briggsae TaxID=6238 RepID=A0AAE9JQG9_CAEBR|nr:hypothetical protein L5515_017159 [Caenorhabditis briggsae]